MPTDGKFVKDRDACAGLSANATDTSASANSRQRIIDRIFFYSSPNMLRLYRITAIHRKRQGIIRSM